MGFPGGSDGKEFCLQCWRPGFDPWVGKFPWRREWQPTPAFLPGEFHGRRSLVGYSPQDLKKLDMTEKLTCVCVCVCVSVSIYIFKIEKSLIWKPFSRVTIDPYSLYGVDFTHFIVSIVVCLQKSSPVRICNRQLGVLSIYNTWIIIWIH